MTVQIADVRYVLMRAQMVWFIDASNLIVVHNSTSYGYSGARNCAPTGCPDTGSTANRGLPRKPDWLAIRCSYDMRAPLGHSRFVAHAKARQEARQDAQIKGRLKGRNPLYGAYRKVEAQQVVSHSEYLHIFHLDVAENADGPNVVPGACDGLPSEYQSFESSLELLINQTITRATRLGSGLSSGFPGNAGNTR
jgi:hypothetical protein